MLGFVTLMVRTDILFIFIAKALFTLQKKLPSVNPGSTWVELTNVDFSSVNAYVPGLNLGKLNPPPVG